ncbi:tRNA-uridine aminocarboxypropyltransferase [Biformimicrobium ophioploci]|uniref:tRNA-uridine aminocarboxypropyltransferase n=1 Tax=Biformimicrobium ophioploci TaxID=3036711 RepID=A0ABQ6LZQ5_9GAMM|nr:tRNA-uridine aminocarboxypropyltransferase [Microbulbifer sp. NKW57]GMG87561.1 hypothetical protein MNKW57_18820 [Microbulbifer sp. NKW57]
MKVFLLTHAREFDRGNSSGALAAGFAPSIVQRVRWSRVEPDPVIIDLLRSHSAALVYPDNARNVEEGAGPEAGSCETARFDSFVLLDGTWQEARKIYNRSPYLQAALKVRIAREGPSLYRRRRNQQPGGLCTAECVIELFEAKGEQALAAGLASAFEVFNALPCKGG